MLNGKEEEGVWCDEDAEFGPFKFADVCGWRPCEEGNVTRYGCPDDNPRAVLFRGTEYWRYSCLAMGDTPLPLNQVTSWSIKLVRLNPCFAREIASGYGIAIGVGQDGGSQEDIDHTPGGCTNFWMFWVNGSSVYTGPRGGKSKDYGPKKEGKDVPIDKGDSVGVVMDTTEGELSFVVAGVNYGPAFDDIPLDKPLFPVVNFRRPGSVVEIVF